MASAAAGLSDAIVQFSLEGRFPEDITALPPVSDTDLEPAIQALAKAKQDLEAELHTINEETKEDVSSWVRNAKTLQEDIIRSKTIANDIVRQSEAPDVSGHAIEVAEEKAGFLNREVQYSQQLHGALRSIHYVNDLLNEVEVAKNERRILDSLRLLEKSWAALDKVGVSKTCRIMRILDIRSFELKSAVHEVFEHVWKTLVNVDIETGKVAIHDSIADEQMKLSDAEIGLQAYKEVDERMEQLWRNVDAAIVTPRMNRIGEAVPKVLVQDDILQLSGNADDSINSLLADLETVFVYVAERLPPTLLQSLAKFAMADVTPRLVKRLLNPAVPSSLGEIDRFQEMIHQAGKFCAALDKHGYSDYDELKKWVDNAPITWLGRCRETSLDGVRRKLMGGIGASKQVERVEKQMVSIAEGKEISKTSGAVAGADANDWGADWGDAWDEAGNQEEEAGESNTKQRNTSEPAEDDGADAWGAWGDDEDADKDAKADQAENEGEDDDSAAAWGWGEEDGAQEPEPQKKPPTPRKSKPTGRKEETRELVLRETFNISSMPEPVLQMIFSILEDGAILTKDDPKYTSVATTAPGLFMLPTMALALFRAISPYYYSLSEGGNMFLYNDAMYLAEQLSDFASKWKEREDLTPRARNMLRLDNDIKSLQGFANRSYGSEMAIQKTVLQDFLGGSQSLMQQDETEDCIESVTARIRTMATVWEPILARSVWSQAVGSLVDALATKLITDVLEMSSIGQDEAYSIAKYIATATELDDLFLPSRLQGGGASGTVPAEDEVPATAQYAPSWLRLKYLSEVLQSNLNDLRFLWEEGELSLYFSVQEVVDLIEASFESNPRTRETVRVIQSKPAPLAGR